MRVGRSFPRGTKIMILRTHGLRDASAKAVKRGGSKRGGRKNLQRILDIDDAMLALMRDMVPIGVAAKTVAEKFGMKKTSVLVIFHRQNSYGGVPDTEELRAQLTRESDGK